MNRRQTYIVALVIFILFSAPLGICSAEPFRVGFPSLATGFAPSWVAADKGDLEKARSRRGVIFLAAGPAPCRQ